MLIIDIPQRGPLELHHAVFDINGTGMDSSAFTRRLMEKNVLASGISPTEIRVVTHMDVDRSACERALAAIDEICG